MKFQGGSIFISGLKTVHMIFWGRMLLPLYPSPKNLHEAKSACCFRLMTLLEEMSGKAGIDFAV